VSLRLCGPEKKERHNAIVNTLFENCVANARSEEVASPVNTLPTVLKRDP
jgi:hypothetical protein